MHKQLIRIVYPTDGGRTVLRTEENWDSNLEAGSVSQDGCVAELSAKFARGDPIVVYNDFLSSKCRHSSAGRAADL